MVTLAIPTVRLAGWMIDTITVASQVGVSGSGDPSYGMQRLLKARVVYGLKAGPSENPPATVVYCESELVVSDRIWLPGADPAEPNESLRPVSVERARDMRGARALWKATL